ncbi:aspartate aminotransferase [Lachnospiraceae bacterium KM106-2]|nr:aspartate aminotransferase [Lachnospiraceae bacterium KM106-2]
MSKFEFDQIIDRRNTNAIKVDFSRYYGMEDDMISMWVADMDFEVPKAITDAMKSRCEHPIYGYTMYDDSYVKSVQSWMKRRHSYEFKKEWLLHTPGVVFGIAMAIRALTKPEEAVMIQTPVYYPFSKMVLKNGRKLVKNSLVLQDGRYVMDYEKIEQQIVKYKVKVFILCSPHNPVGRVWTQEELIRLGDLLVRHDVKIISDEIHMDFIYPGHKHQVLAGLRKEYENRLVTCTAPSKTFNLAGLQMSNLFIANDQIRAAVKAEIEKTGYDEPNLFGPIACQAAYDNGEAWLDELLEYLAENIQFTKKFLQEHMPKVKLIEPEGSYLLWVDFRAYGMSNEALNERIRKKAKVWLDAGEMFGSEGNGFQRINIATSRKTLEKALNNLANAFCE